MQGLIYHQQDPLKNRLHSRGHKRLFPTTTAAATAAAAVVNTSGKTHGSIVRVDGLKLTTEEDVTQGTVGGRDGGRGGGGGGHELLPVV